MKFVNLQRTLFSTKMKYTGSISSEVKRPIRGEECLELSFATQSGFSEIYIREHYFKRQHNLCTISSLNMPLAYLIVRKPIFKWYYCLGLLFG